MNKIYRVCLVLVMIAFVIVGSGFSQENVLDEPEVPKSFGNNELIFHYHENAINLERFDDTNWGITVRDDYSDTVNKLYNCISPRTVLYFAANGNDNNSGLTEDLPKKNPAEYIKKGNITVLLKSGDTFYLTKGLEPGSQVKISTYGGSERASISLVQSIIHTVELYNSGKNIYRVKLNGDDKDVGWVSINGEIMWKKLLSNDLNWDKEYYVDNTSGYLYIKSNSVDLRKEKIEYSSPYNGIYLKHGSDAIIENIEICGAGYSGILFMFYSNVVVKDCYVHDIGGGIQSTTQKKYGNGISIWANKTSNIYIYHNKISNCFDSGISAQINENQQGDSDNIIFANNYVEFCNYNFEFFQYGNEYAITNTIVANNLFYMAKDITNGYRLTDSSTDYTAQFCLWHCTNPRTSCLIKNNFALSSQKYAISYAFKNSVDCYQFEENEIIVESIDPIKNEKNYYGDRKQYKVLTSNTEYLYYSKIFKYLQMQYGFN